MGYRNNTQTHESIIPLQTSVKTVAPENLSQTLEVLLPLKWKHILFLVIAGFATGNEIVFCTHPPTGKRHEMVHGEVFKS